MPAVLVESLVMSAVEWLMRMGSEVVGELEAMVGGLKSVGC